MMNYTQNEMQIMGMMIEVIAIPGLPVYKQLSEKAIEDAYGGLKKQGLVDQEEQLTDAGQQQLLALKIFCDAKVHMNIGGMMVGKYEGRKNVILVKYQEQYTIYLVSDSELVMMILSRLPEVNQIMDEKFKRQRMSKEKFKEVYDGLAGKEALYYEKRKEGTPVGLGIIYVNEGYLMIYDQKEEVLKKYPKYMVQGAIEELVG